MVFMNTANITTLLYNRPLVSTLKKKGTYIHVLMTTYVTKAMEKFSSTCFFAQVAPDWLLNPPHSLTSSLGSWFSKAPNGQSVRVDFGRNPGNLGG